MSLKVWLPLNGDLTQQGTANTTFSGTPAWKTYGKIGNAALNLQNKITCTTTALNGVQFFSVTFWARIENNPDSTANWMDVIGFIDQTSGGSNGQFRFETGYGNTAYSGVHWHDNATNAIINGSYTYNTGTEFDKWHHIAVTISNTAVCSYYDGVLKSTLTSNLNKGHLTGAWWLGEATTRGCIQDVRIYDHALSAAEVREISQGLVLHYKLDDMSHGIQDSSGYNHNGEILNGPLTLSTDTARYSNSIHFSATNKKIKIANFPTSGFGNSYSFSWWAKISSVSPMHWGFSDGIRLNGMYTGRLWNTGDGSNNPLYNLGTTTQVTAPTVNTWHHWVMTGNGTKCYVYRDGELWAEAKTYKAISGTTIYINGWDTGTNYSSNNYLISDFRIYCTALDADAVRQLYELGAKIDNKQNLHTFELIEDQSSIKVTKQGQIKCDDLAESTTTKFYKSKDINTNNLIEL